MVKPLADGLSNRGKNDYCYTPGSGANCLSVAQNDGAAITLCGMAVYRSPLECQNLGEMASHVLKSCEMSDKVSGLDADSRRFNLIVERPRFECQTKDDSSVCSSPAVRPLTQG